jgi:hypothetical protein
MSMRQSFDKLREEVETEKNNLEVDYFIDDKKEEIKTPSIVALDEIPKYSNVFVSVYPFIFYGYRIHHSIHDCFLSIFKLHNETMNIWTHLIPFFVFIFLFIFELTSKYFYLNKVRRD